MKNEKIQISNNKTLKLTNVITKEFDLQENEGLDKEIIKMENYIKNKGAQPIGPIVQYTTIGTCSETQDAKVVIKLLRQANTFLHNVESPYSMEAVLRVKNCIYARFKGNESKLKLAYDKINITAFEEDISLKGDSYTIFVANNDGDLIADVFMECENNE